MWQGPVEGVGGLLIFFCHFSHCYCKGVASALGSDQELAAEFLQSLLQFVVLDI